MSSFDQKKEENAEIIDYEENERAASYCRRKYEQEEVGRQHLLVGIYEQKVMMSLIKSMKNRFKKYPNQLKIDPNHKLIQFEGVDKLIYTYKPQTDDSLIRIEGNDGSAVEIPAKHKHPVFQAKHKHPVFQIINKDKSIEILFLVNEDEGDDGSEHEAILSITDHNHKEDIYLYDSINQTQEFHLSGPLFKEWIKSNQQIIYNESSFIFDDEEYDYYTHYRNYNDFWNEEETKFRGYKLLCHLCGEIRQKINKNKSMCARI